MQDLKVYRESGNNKVRVESTKYGMELSICTNGWQWTGQNVNVEIFEMIQECADELKELIEGQR
jgi:hypothetical protein